MAQIKKIVYGLQYSPFGICSTSSSFRAPSDKQTDTPGAQACWNRAVSSPFYAWQSTKLQRPLTQSLTSQRVPQPGQESPPNQHTCFVPFFQPPNPREVRCKIRRPLALTSARRECLCTFSPFCTLGASCCRTPLLLVRALVSRANFPQPGAHGREKRQVQAHPKGTWTFTLPVML